MAVWTIPGLARAKGPLSTIGSPSAPTLPTPPALEGAVRFWEKIFYAYDSGHVILHDREYLEIIWDVVELPRRDDGHVDEERAAALVRSRWQALCVELQRWGGGGDARAPLSAERSAALALLAPEQRAEAWRRVRGQRGAADAFRRGYERAKAWQEEIADVLASRGLPADLAALPFVESMYNPDARSHAGAAGLWQLMPGTARWLGLQVTPSVDERLQVSLATRAAADLLRSNFKQLQAWPLAVTAYNHGAYGVKKAVRAVGSDRLADLVALYDGRLWGFASKNFYAEVLAARNVAARHKGAEEAQALLAARLREVALGLPCCFEDAGSPVHARLLMVFPDRRRRWQSRTRL